MHFLTTTTINKINLMKHIVALFMTIFLFNCENKAQSNSKKQALLEVTPMEVPIQNGKAKAYFASGCFWCAEAIYESIKGVDEAISGYSGGFTDNPSYKSTSTGATGHAEAIEVIYDPEVISFEELVEVYFSSQDPTQVNGQGPDKGSQYRSIIFYQNDEQKQIAEKKKAEWGKKLNSNIAAEIVPFQKFYVAEDYHQDFERLNPTNPYIRNVSNKRLQQLRQSCPLLLKKEH